MVFDHDSPDLRVVLLALPVCACDQDNMHARSTPVIVKAARPV
jgi:hypothetical protein